MVTHKKKVHRTVDRVEETPPKSVRGFYFAVAVAYGRNGRVSASLNDEDTLMKRVADEGEGNVLAEIRHLGFRAHRSTLIARAEAHVKSVPADAGPWYHQESGDPAHVRIFTNIFDIIREVFK